LKHPCLISGWLSCLYIDLQRTLCQTNVGRFCQMCKLLGYSRLKEWRRDKKVGDKVL
jgi:hypothetical protein